MENLRRAHPYHMYEAIQQQPERIARLLASQRTVIEHAAQQIARCGRIVYAGIGTSLHAARLGERFLRHLTAGRATALVEESFELVHAPLALSKDDAVILTSHRGWKNSSVEALQRAKAAGAFTVAITGEGSGQGMQAADGILATCEQEIASAHTKSYTTALAAHARLAAGVAQHRGWLADAGAPGAVEGISGLVEQSLAAEPAARAAAKIVAQRERLIFLGAGMNSITAQEAALKVKETSYLHAEGFLSEEFLHGPVAECDARATAVALLDGGPADARTRQALRAAQQTGAVCVAVVSAGAAREPAAQLIIEVPAAPGWLTVFPHTVAVQLLAYFTALERGTNPDTAREEQPTHARAKQYDQL
jgi:glucosamine--fructose-6-phosphate aminotransferase (isomerizing)